MRQILASHGHDNFMTTKNQKDGRSLDEEGAEQDWHFVIWRFPDGSEAFRIPLSEACRLFKKKPKPKTKGEHAAKEAK